MSAFDERRSQDVQKLRSLQATSNGRFRLERVMGEPVSDLHVELLVRTVASQDYPNKVQDRVSMHIVLPARYPFVEPTVNVTSPILHPNIYASGRICLGLKWIPSFGLDLLMQRIAQLITYDASILNEQSPANSTALSWYRSARDRFPGAFPTDHFRLGEPAPVSKKISWGPDQGSGRVQRACPSCRATLSLPSGKSGRVRCPTCSHTFEAST